MYVMERHAMAHGGIDCRMHGTHMQREQDRRPFCEKLLVPRCARVWQVVDVLYGTVLEADGRSVPLAGSGGSSHHQICKSVLYGVWQT